jgi:hypothetical protein
MQLCRSVFVAIRMTSWPCFLAAQLLCWRRIPLGVSNLGEASPRFAVLSLRGPWAWVWRAT